MCLQIFRARTVPARPRFCGTCPAAANLGTSACTALPGFRSCHHKGESPHARNSAPAAQPRNPLHGVTLEAIVRALEARYGWPDLARQVPVRCFTLDPSVSSSLKFLRKTPWAREKVEALYLDMLRKDRRRPASTD